MSTTPHLHVQNMCGQKCTCTNRAFYVQVHENNTCNANTAVHVKSPGYVIVKVHNDVWKLSESTAVNYYESPQQHQLPS